METVQEAVYARGWPGRVWDRVPAATRVREVRHELDAGRVGRAPLKLAFASDVHLGPLTPPRLLDAAFAALARWRPDVLVLGGDYVSFDVTPAKAARLTALVASVPATTKVGVLGNHDLWTDHGVIERALAAGGVRVLVNESLSLPSPHDDVALVGLDDPWSGAPDAARAFAGVTAPVRIAVAHAPEGQPFIAGRGAALMLCGHTHGGQVALPSGPVVVHGPLGRRWPAGLYDVDGLPLYVGRGLGTVDLPLRLFAPAEVALFTIA
ncbi:MAG: Phosphoesterase [Myxococcales bacterium]|nr:Phosphoesterase [Myxococcales bacterium]